MFDFPRIPFTGRTVGYDIYRIPKIETDAQRVALTLYREALSSNNNFLSFLFFWQILETGKTEAIGWVNKTYRKKRERLYITEYQLKILDIGVKKLGNYFYDDWRNAIAHIRSKPGKRSLKLDTQIESRRLAVSTRVVQEFARLYIRDELKLDKKLYLVRKSGRGFPFYADDDYLRKNYCTAAYKAATFHKLRKKKWL